MASGTTERLSGLSRADDGAVLFGVCAGLGARWGTRPRWLRVAFLIAALGSGVGVVLYVLLALLMPAPGEMNDGFGRRLSQRLGDLRDRLADAGRELADQAPRWFERRRDVRILEQVRAVAGLAAFALGGLILMDSFDLLDWLTFGRIVGLILCVVGLGLAFGSGDRDAG